MTDNVKLKVMKLHEDAVIPRMATAGAAGMDLTAVTVEKEGVFTPVDPKGYCYQIGEKHTYGTGLAFEIPQGHVGLIFPRSSIHKYDMTLSNCVGVIDSDYRGEVKAVFRHGRHGEVYQPGDRVAQMVIVKLPAVEIEEVERLSSTDRGEGGFGSTGR